MLKFFTIDLKFLDKCIPKVLLLVDDIGHLCLQIGQLILGQSFKHEALIAIGPFVLFLLLFAPLEVGDDQIHDPLKTEELVVL